MYQCDNAVTLHEENICAQVKHWLLSENVNMHLYNVLQTYICMFKKCYQLLNIFG